MCRVAVISPQPNRSSARRRNASLRLCNVLAAAVVASWLGQIDTHASTDIADQAAARIQQLLNEMSTAYQRDNKLS